MAGCTGLASDSVPVIAVGPAAHLEALAGRYAPNLAASGRAKAAEGYRIRVEKTGRGAPAVFIIGNDSRGMLFGVGRFLRELQA